MKTPLYLIVGASGSGKDYIVDKICKELDMTRVISRTTRRSRGANDLHIFVDACTAGEEIGRSIARTDYNGNLYYVLPEDIEDADFYIIDVKGVYTLFNEQDKGIPCLQRDIEIIFIDAPWYVRFINMIKRGDKLKDIFRRLSVDRIEFDEFEGDYNFNSSNDVYNFFKRYSKIIQLRGNYNVYNEKE